jgi:hypothetical protein
MKFKCRLTVLKMMKIMNYWKLLNYIIKVNLF